MLSRKDGRTSTMAFNDLDDFTPSSVLGYGAVHTNISSKIPFFVTIISTITAHPLAIPFEDLSTLGLDFA